MTKCAACSADVDENWAWCPACGQALTRVCATCGVPLQPGWKVCPGCGTAPNVAATAATESIACRELPLQESYSIFRRTRRALLAPFEEVFEELGAAGDRIKAALQSVRANRLEQALQAGVDGIARELSSTEKVSRSARAEAELASVRAVCAEWIEAKNAIEEEKIPEGFFEHLVHGFSDPSGKAAIGATIGSIVPGIGPVLGVIVGGFFGGQESGKRHAALLERFHRVADRLRQALIEAHPFLLERLAADNRIVLRRPAAKIHAGLIELDDAAEMINAELNAKTPSFGECEGRARRCVELLPEESACHSLLGVVLQAAGQFGAAMDAVRVAVETDPKELTHWTQMVGLLCEADHADEALGWLAKIAEYWPDDPDAHRCLAEGYLFAGRPDIAHKWAELALAASKDDVVLMLLSARIEARLNRLDHAAELLMLVAPIALASIEDWRITLSEPEFASAANTAPAAGLLSKPLDYARLATLCLSGLARTDAFLGRRAPAPKIEAARKTFLRGVFGNEPILWYYDSTVFGSGSDGIALTHRRIAWKALMEEPVVVPFAKIEGVEINDELGLVLRGRGSDKACSCPDLEMTEALFRFLTIVRAVETM